MNIYIWVLLLLRILYIGLLLLFFLEKGVTDDGDFTDMFFWLVFATYVWVRMMFSLIVLKILTVGHRIGDPKIKIVYECYIRVA
jgi:ABC-type Fe3+ transport system permease subunit